MMTATRREFLSYGGAWAASGLIAPAAALTPAPPTEWRAACFDAFTIFDPRSLQVALEGEVPGKGAELASAWRAKIFEYCWLRTLYGRYADFRQTVDESLDVVLEAAKIALGSSARARILSVWLQLDPWPDSAQALRALRAGGLRLAYLSNFTAEMLDANGKRLQVPDLFEFRLTTDAVQAYKPDPRAYAMGVASFGLAKSEILFVAFGGWDAAGAKAYGYPTAWINRTGAVPEKLGMQPDWTGSSLRELAQLLRE
jgi:2-haloacid dehalogenase